MENELFPKAIEIGCPADEFWYGEPKVFWIYLKAFRDRKKTEIKAWREKTNAAAWIQGIYISAAIGACLPGGSKYPQRPIEIFSDNDGNSQNALPEHSESGNIIEDNIRAQSAKIDALLAEK